MKFINRIFCLGHIDEDCDAQLHDIPAPLREGLMSGGCDKLESGHGEFGRCLANPIPANGPNGECKYLSMLKPRVVFHRLGSMISIQLGRVIDLYEVVTLDRTKWDILYFDFHHPRRSRLSPKGFTLRDYHKIFNNSLLALGTNRFDKTFPHGIPAIMKERISGSLGEKSHNKVLPMDLMNKDFRRPKDYLIRVSNIIKTLDTQLSNAKDSEAVKIIKQRLNEILASSDEKAPYFKALSDLTIVTKQDKNMCDEVKFDEVKKWLDQATTKLNSGDSVGAEEDSTIAIELLKKLRPDEFPGAYFVRGSAKYNMTNYMGAIEDFTKVIHLEPENGEVYRLRGLAKYKLQDYAEAIQDFNIAIKIHPKYPDSYSDRGLAKFYLHDYIGAIQDFTKTIEFDPKDDEVYFNRGHAKGELQDLAGGIQDFTKAIELNPKHARAYFSRGAAKHLLQDYTGAIQDCNKSIELHPKYAEAYWRRGDAKFGLQDGAGAIEDYTKAIGLNPKEVHAYFGRGCAKFNLKDYTGAIQDSTKAIELIPKFVGAYFIRGDVKHLLQDYTGAIQDFTKAIELTPQYAETYYKRGLAKYELKDKQGALADFSKACELGNTRAYERIKEIEKEP